LIVNKQRIDSRKSLEVLLSTIDRADPLIILVQRNQELLELQINP
jgi:hypothetical protein